MQSTGRIRRTRRIYIRLTAGEFSAIDRQRRAAGYRSVADFARLRLMADDASGAHDLVEEMRRLTVALKNHEPSLGPEAIAILRKALDKVQPR